MVWNPLFGRLPLSSKASCVERRASWNRVLHAHPRLLSRVWPFLVILWTLTLAVSNAPWLTVTVFWVAVGSGILLWARRDFRKDLSDILRGYESARYRNEAEVFEIQAKSFVEFEEVEDEGAYYAFEIGADRIVFVTGQEFYPGPKYSVSRLRAGLHPQRAGRPC